MDIIAVKADIGGSNNDERGDGGTTPGGRGDQFCGVPANPHGAVISHAAKLSLHTYFERVAWPRNRSGALTDRTRHHIALSGQGDAHASTELP
jgi:hypothetical protein